MTGSAARPRALAEGRLVLLAEDHPVNRELVLMQLEMLGVAADAVEDGLAAWAALEAVDYDLLLTDCHMPGLDGWDLARRIRLREEDGRRRLPVVALTAASEPQDLARCREAGIDDCIPKPIELGALEALIARWLPEPGDEEPAIDTASLEELVDDDGEALDRLLEAFRDTLAKDLAALDCAAGEAGAEIAHRIGGAARIVGAARLARACAAYEALGATAAAETLRTALAELRAAAAEAAAATDRARESIGGLMR